MRVNAQWWPHTVLALAHAGLAVTKSATAAANVSPKARRLISSSITLSSPHSRGLIADVTDSRFTVSASGPANLAEIEGAPAACRQARAATPKAPRARRRDTTYGHACVRVTPPGGEWREWADARDEAGRTRDEAGKARDGPQRRRSSSGAGGPDCRDSPRIGAARRPRLGAQREQVGVAVPARTYA